MHFLSMMYMRRFGARDYDKTRDVTQTLLRTIIAHLVQMACLNLTIPTFFHFHHTSNELIHQGDVYIHDLPLSSLVQVMAWLMFDAK